MFAATFIALCLTTALAGDTPVGRWLRHQMIERPAAALNRIGRDQIIIASVVIALLALAIFAGENDALRLLGMAAPDITVWLTSIEIGAVLDAAVALASVLSVAKIARRLPLSALLDGLKRPRPRATRSPRKPAPANDDEDGPAFALIA